MHACHRVCGCSGVLAGDKITFEQGSRSCRGEECTASALHSPIVLWSVALRVSFVSVAFVHPLCCRYGPSSVLLRLIAAGADLRWRDSFGCTVLMHLIQDICRWAVCVRVCMYVCACV